MIWLFILGGGYCYADDYVVHLGDETVVVNVMGHGLNKVFVHVHQNETTALKAAKSILKEQQGRVITLRHHGKRNIRFTLNHKQYEFDPNRIFTDRGIQKTLSQFGAYDYHAHQEVLKLANQIKKLLPRDAKVIAIHNNQYYSFKDYLPGHHLARDAACIHHIDKSHDRNFFLVTQRDDYERLKAFTFNSILQTQNVTDDGSLSVYLSNQNYINVEAGYDALKAQIQMLKMA